VPLPYRTNPSFKTLPVYQPGRPNEEVARELNLPVESIVKLASNENPLGPSRLALAAMRKTLPSLHLYPDGNAFYVKRKLAEKLSVGPDNLIFGNGSNEIIELLGHALLFPNPHGGGATPEVLVSEYCFAVYPIVTALFGAKLVVTPAKKFGHDLDAMLKAITPATRLIFVANPNNPTGTTVSAEELSRFIEAVPPQTVVAMDEAYIEFLEGAPDLLPRIRDGSRPNLILMRTFSKIYGLAGLRLGYGIAHPELILELEKARQPFNINALAQAAALAALDDTAHVEKTRKANQRGLKFFARAFRKLGLEFIPSAANFILVRVGDGSRVFAEMQKQGIITRPMAGYQLPEWLRITIGTTKQNERCLKSLADSLNPQGSAPTN
jgi:histidinol-phosphate aminotransferase